MTSVIETLTARLAGLYGVERQLGQGGMATVYLARDLRHDRQVAIKVLRPELAAVVGAERFLHEINVVAGLQHPHILGLIDSGRADSLVYFVMPFVAGESLRHRLQRETQLPVEEALRITREVADALAYAHHHGVIHRDIKPENILIDSGHAVVADFGIARSARAGIQVSSVGLAIGTPAYMSPENWKGEAVDGRADLYSLGCVLYEMLTGAPPFTGPNADRVAVLHLMEPPRPIRTSRPTAPAGIQRVIDLLLAKSPADRVQTADELVTILTGSATPVSVAASRARVSRWMAAAVVGIGLIVLFTLWFQGRAPPLDAERFVVLPFRHRGDAAPQLVNGDMCESLIYEALGRWRDLSVANSLLVRDAIERRGGQVASLQGGLDLARELGAGRLLWGEVWETGDTTVVRAAVYDAGDGQVIHEHTIRMQQGTVGSSFAALADTLVVRSAGLTAPAQAGTGTLSFIALREYARSHAAAARWDLSEAAARLRAALAADPAYPQAHLRLAQIAQWQGLPSRTWREDVVASLAGGWVSNRDSALARALLDLADRRFQDGCQRYRSLVARDSLDFAAWYGLGECQARDRTVLRDSTSPSGWRFASSGQAAVEAYTRALTVVPSVHVVYQGAALARLQELLYVDPELVRPGMAIEGLDTLRFASFPSLAADTLGFIPWLATDLFAGRPEALPESRPQALRRNRELLRRLAETWVRAYPRSLPALETYVVALELNGELGGTVQGMPTALEAVRQMRALAPTDVYRRDAMLWETRIRLKQGDFAAARAVADSLLRGLDLGHAQAHRFAPAAALTGRIQLAADLLASGAPVWTPTAPDMRPVEVPVPVRADALRLMAYASFGAPADSLTALSRRVRAGVAAYIVGAVRPVVEAALLDRAAIFAFPLLPTPETAQNYMLELQRAVRRRDLTTVRARLDTIAAARRGQRPGDMALEVTLAEASLRLAAADSAGATTQLDQALEALASFGMGLLREVPPAAALGRAMALRAELAAAVGDQTSARRWARALITLWSNA
ncbi:MAG TPA: serine/threonine-protein kinase, partial [Gemmatimonadales bacterium]